MSKVKEKVKEKLSSTEGDGTTDEEKNDDGDGEDMDKTDARITYWLPIGIAGPRNPHSPPPP
jgi:hypothetical protein